MNKLYFFVFCVLFSEYKIYGMYKDNSSRTNQFFVQFANINFNIVNR